MEQVYKCEHCDYTDEVPERMSVHEELCTLKQKLEKAVRLLKSMERCMAFALVRYETWSEDRDTILQELGNDMFK